MIMADIDRLESAVRAIVARNRSDPFKLFVFGKTGAGKSSLINTLLNSQVAREGAGLRSQTKQVEAYTGNSSLEMLQTTVNDVPVVLWDSPGLNDPYISGDETLRTIKDNCQDADLFVYNIQITQSRMGQDDFDSVAELTNALGKGIWKRALFALTFANQLKTRSSSRESDDAKMLKERVSEWKEVLQDAVERAGLSRDQAAEIPIVPTSYRQIPLPGVPDWNNDFWIKGLSRTKHWSKFIAMLQITSGNWIQDQKRIEILADEFERRSVEVGRRLAQLGDQLDEECAAELREALSKADEEFQALVTGKNPLMITQMVVRVLFAHIRQQFIPLQKSLEQILLTHSQSSNISGSGYCVAFSYLPETTEFNPHLKLIHYTLLAQSYMLLCVESYIHWEIVTNPFLELHACNAIHADRSVHSIITYSCLDSIQ